MGKIFKNKDEKCFNKLIGLFKGKFSISDRNYEENNARLDICISNYQEEFQRKCMRLSPEKNRNLADIHRLKLEGIPIKYNEVVLKHKKKKYKVKSADLSNIRNEELNLLLNTPPSKAVSGLSDEALRKHSLLLQTQEAFFKYRMHQKKQELINWLRNLFPLESSPEDPDDQPIVKGLSLRQLIIVANLLGILALVEELCGQHLATVLCILFNRPRNKIAEFLKKLYDPASGLKNSPRYLKDLEIAEKFIEKYKDRQH